MPASGKSTIAAKLAETLGIRVLRSDVIRKELFNVERHTSMVGAFGKGLYSKEAGSLTYGKLLLLAQEEIEKGESVILDATFSKERYRREALCLARDMDVNIVFIECVAPKRILKERLMGRKKKPGVSDARIHHFDQMKASFESLTEVPGEMLIKVDTHQPIDESLFQILSKDHVLIERKATEAIRG
jgi:predicted kinase